MGDSQQTWSDSKVTLSADMQTRTIPITFSNRYLEYIQPMSSGTQQEQTPLRRFRRRVPDKLTAEPTPDVIITGIEGGQGLPLLLLHGFPQSSIAWLKILVRLMPHFTCIAMDLRGYGGSSKPSHYLGLERPPTDEEKRKEHDLYNECTMAKDCINMMDGLGYSKFLICGHDRGARVAHSVCALFPAAIIKAIFLDISPTLKMYQDTNMDFAQDYFHWFFLTQPYPLPEKCITSHPLEFMKRFMPIYKQLEGGAMLKYLDQLSDFRAVHSMCEDYRATLEIDYEQAQDDLEDNVRLMCPLKVLWAKRGILNDEDIPNKPLHDWKAVHGTGDVTGAPIDCGHFMLDEKPDEIARAMLAFFLAPYTQPPSDEDGDEGDEDVGKKKNKIELVVVNQAGESQRQV
ncbi:hypothetical protein KEM56_000867 [Ascosphaera pollenicola]|nr:hypothetical protein KEM56_000867 [Ascosphaera pollenicola]